MTASSPSVWSRLFMVLAIVVAVAGAVTSRVLVAGERELTASTEALEEGDPHEAIVRARRAAGWYAPGAPHVRVAYDRLVALAEAAEEHRRDDLALLAWRSLRSAAIETRWVVTPHAAELRRANREIARLSAEVPGKKDPDAEIRSEQLQKLLRHDPPRRLWAGALVLGFVLLTAGLGLGARRAARAGGGIDGRVLGLPALVALAGVALWLAALWQA